MLDNFANVLDEFFVMILILAIVAVILGGGHADTFITTAGKALTNLIKIIQSPAGGGGTSK